MAAPRSLAPVSVTCCRKLDRSIPSDIARHRGADCTAERCRHSWVGRKARCSCTRAHRTARIRPSRPIHRRCRRDRWSQRHRQHRPSPWCRRARQRRLRRMRRPFRPPRPLHHPEEGRRRRDSRRWNRRRCRARSPDTTPDSARILRCHQPRLVHPAIPPRHRFRPRFHHLRLFRLRRRHSIHRHRPVRVWPSIRTLQPPATIEEGRSTA